MSIEENAPAFQVLGMSTILGGVAAFLIQYEKGITFSIEVVEAQQKADPENPAIPVLLNLLLSAQKFIESHKAALAMADMGQKGATRVDGTETVQ